MRAPSSRMRIVCFVYPVLPSASDEFPQSRHLGEGPGHVLGSASSGDANPGRRDHDAVGAQYT